MWLTDTEIDELCAPLTQPAAQVRFLRAELGLYVETKRNGRALVLKSHFEAVMSGQKGAASTVPSTAKAAPTTVQPDRGALLTFIGKNKHGTSSRLKSA
jgi:hypothetical protein